VLFIIALIGINAAMTFLMIEVGKETKASPDGEFYFYFRCIWAVRLTMFFSLQASCASTPAVASTVPS
jgi:hypothetical protein